MTEQTLTQNYGDSATLDIFNDCSDRARIKKNSKKFESDTKYSNITELKTDQIIEGKLIASNMKEYTFDIGYKAYVSVPKGLEENPYLNLLNIGDTSELYIKSFTDLSYTFNIVGSIAAAKASTAHDTLTNLDENSFIYAYVKEVTPAGFTMQIDFEGTILDAFMPNVLAGINKLREGDAEKMLNTTLEVCVESFSSEKGTYIVSRKAYLKKLIPSKIASLERNVVYTGTITGCAEFGVFVEFETYLTGLIHKSCIHSDFRDKIMEIPEGTEIDFYVKDVLKGDKIILTQILEETLWETLQTGDIFEVKCKNITPFGVLVELDSEVNGLIRKNELKNDPADYNVGETIKAEIVSIDKQSRKIFLTDIIK